MEYTSVSPAQSSRVKTASLIALAIVGTMVASYAMLNISQTQLVQVSSNTNGSNNTDCIDEWNAWKANHSKSFSAAENDIRFLIFCNKSNEIKAHNSNPSNTYTLAHNHLSHLSQAEFAATSLGLNHPGKDSSSEPQGPARLLATLPTTVNWVTAGAVTPVKNQGQCGSCYTFSSTGSLEGLNFIKNKKLVSLSEQELVDCSTSYGNGGCNGGWMGNCYNFVIANGGLSGETVYTTYSAQAGTCKNSTAKAYTGLTGSAWVTASQTALMTAIAQQPVSVCVEADQTVFQSYSSGIINNAAACGTSIDHAVLAVGYNQTGQYWLVKNSWGTGWGESGYVRIAFTNTTDTVGMCGILKQNIYPQ